MKKTTFLLFFLPQFLHGATAPRIYGKTSPHEDINFVEESTWMTHLHKAVQNRDQQQIRLCLDRKVDIEAVTITGHTALDLAFEQVHQENFLQRMRPLRALLQQGAHSKIEKRSLKRDLDRLRNGSYRELKRYKAKFFGIRRQYRKLRAKERVEKGQGFEFFMRWIFPPRENTRGS